MSSSYSTVFWFSLYKLTQQLFPERANGLIDLVKIINFSHNPLKKIKKRLWKTLIIFTAIDRPVYSDCGLSGSAADKPAAQMPIHGV